MTREERFEMEFRALLAGRVIDFCGGNPQQAACFLLSLGLGIMLETWGGRRDACATQFEGMARGIVEELRNEEQDTTFERMH